MEQENSNEVNHENQTLQNEKSGFMFFMNDIKMKNSPPSAFFDFSIPKNYSVDSLYSKCKNEIPRFSLYYFSIAVVIYFIFIFCHPFYILPLLITALLYFVLNHDVEIYGVYLTPMMSLIGFFVLHGLIIIVKPSFLNSHVSFFTVTSLNIFIAILHSIFVTDKNVSSCDNLEERLLIGGI